jgi:hypothetical protein
MHLLKLFGCSEESEDVLEGKPAHKDSLRHFEEKLFL